MSEPSTQPVDTRIFSPATRNYALGVLTVVYTFNFIDRQILSILVEPIKAELGFSNFQIGLLTGLAFAMFYATLGIPIARLADKHNRRNIIALAVTIWSFFTAISGLAGNFWQMLLARVGVAVGEAGGSPPSHSMISDYYPADKRATALGIYSLGIPVGILFGFFVGGWINEFFGWRWAFAVVGIPGLVVALVVRFTLREPPRGMAEARSAVVEAPSVWVTFGTLWRKPTFRHMAFGGALAAFVGYGMTNFAASFFILSFDMKTGEVGTMLGLLFGIPGGIGIALGGYLSDRMGARDKRWALWVVAAALSVSVPFTVIALTSKTAWMAWFWLCIPVMLSNFYQATTFAQTQGLVALRMRAVASAVLLFVLNIIGLGLGPTITGLIADLLEPNYGQEAIRYSLMICSFVYLWSAFHYFMAGRHLENDLVTDDVALAKKPA